MYFPVADEIAQIAEALSRFAWPVSARAGDSQVAFGEPMYCSFRSVNIVPEETGAGAKVIHYYMGSGFFDKAYQ